VDFKNTVLIMTSNIGSTVIQEAMASRQRLDDPTKQEVMEQLRQQFRPEFLNRVDEIVIFEPLRREDIGRIIDLQLKRLQKLLAERNLQIELHPSAREFLIERGYDPVYGARPLKRAIQKYLQDPLAMKVLAGEFRPGDSIIAEAAKDELRLVKKSRA
ncbi:MAG TPA: AAA family ATPase, partial [Myxococcaceae bacterium]|nr:AAA family ATPase [Myxococcaceae bacterium]